MKYQDGTKIIRKTSKFTIAFTLFILLLFMQTINATPIFIWNSSNNLIGANRVEVMGVNFDVRFIDSSCDIIWDGCDRNLFRFPVRSLASAASQALLDQVLIDDFPLITLDSLPWKVNGIESDTVGFILTPYQLISSSINSVYLRNAAGSGVDSSGATWGMSRNLNTGVDAVYARWFVSSVPEPSTIPLLISGLLGLIITHRKHKLAR